jgi:hypothetical protein
MTLWRWAQGHWRARSPHPRPRRQLGRQRLQPHHAQAAVWLAWDGPGLRHWSGPGPRLQECVQAQTQQPLLGLVAEDRADQIATGWPEPLPVVGVQTRPACRSPCKGGSSDSRDRKEADRLHTLDPRGSLRLTALNRAVPRLSLRSGRSTATGATHRAGGRHVELVVARLVCALPDARALPLAAWLPAVTAYGAAGRRACHQHNCGVTTTHKATSSTTSRPRSYQVVDGRPGTDVPAITTVRRTRCRSNHRSCLGQLAPGGGHLLVELGVALGAGPLELGDRCRELSAREAGNCCSTAVI